MQVAAAIATITQRLQSGGLQGRLTAKEGLLLRLNEQYPGDVGVLAALFLNLVTLKAGQVRFSHVIELRFRAFQKFQHHIWLFDKTLKPQPT